MTRHPLPEKGIETDRPGAVARAEPLTVGIPGRIHRLLTEHGVPGQSLLLGSADEPVPVHQHTLQRACADDRVLVLW